MRADLPFKTSISFHTGLDYSQSLWLKHDNSFAFSTVNLLMGVYDIDLKKAFAGYEGEFSVKASNKSTTHELSTVIRYTDFPSSTVPFISRAHFAGISENCTFPGKILVNYSYVIPGILEGTFDGSFGIQTLASFGKNSDGSTPQTNNPLNFKLEEKIAFNMELAVPLAVGQKIATGLSTIINWTEDKIEPDFNFYISCKLNWLRR